MSHKMCAVWGVSFHFGRNILKTISVMFYHKSHWNNHIIVLVLWTPVDAGSSHGKLLSVPLFITYEYWSSLFRLMLRRNMYTRDGAVSVITMSSLVAPRVVFVTACVSPGRCGVVTLTAPPCSSVYSPTKIQAEFSTSTDVLISWNQN